MLVTRIQTRPQTIATRIQSPLGDQKPSLAQLVARRIAASVATSPSQPYQEGRIRARTSPIVVAAMRPATMNAPNTSPVHVIVFSPTSTPPLSPAAAMLRARPPATIVIEA